MEYLKLPAHTTVYVKLRQVAKERRLFKVLAASGYRITNCEPGGGVVGSGDLYSHEYVISKVRVGGKYVRA